MSTAVSTAGGVVSPVVFSTDYLPPMQRLEAWNAAFGTLNAISVPDTAQAISGTYSENWMLPGGMVLSASRVPTARFTRDARRARQDGLDHWVLRVLRRGVSEVRHPSFSARIGPGEPVLYSFHESWVTDWIDAEWVSLCIPRDTHPQLSFGLGGLARGPLRGAAAGLLADLMLALPSRLAAARPEEVPALAEAMRAAIAVCLLTGVTPPPAAAADLAKERVRQAIRRHIGSARLTPDRLAVAAGLSRSALYRLFEAEGGVARAIRAMRLSLVHAALRDPALAHRPIADLAEAHGFPDPSTFSRAFRDAFGASPGEVRATGLPGPAPPVRCEHAQTASSTAHGDLAARLYGRLAPRGRMGGGQGFERIAGGLERPEA